MTIQRVFLDANVLFSRTLRDWIFMLKLNSEGDMFTIASSEDVIVEVQNRLRKNKPELPGKTVSDVRKHITQILDELAIDYEVSQVPHLEDKFDWHVHAAVKKLGCDQLITSDKGFISNSDDLDFEVLHPDVFLTLIDDNWHSLVRQVTESQRDYWRNKESKTVAKSNSLSQALINAGCPMFAARIDKHLKALAGI